MNDLRARGTLRSDRPRRSARSSLTLVALPLLWLGACSDGETGPRGGAVEVGCTGAQCASAGADEDGAASQGGADVPGDEAGQDSAGSTDTGPQGEAQASVPQGCTDQDGDGLGEGCEAGPDCDDGDAQLGGPDICDTLDNDCDGQIDEFLVDVCSVCGSSCTLEPTPGPGEAWETPTEENSESVIIDAGGALTLDRATMDSFAVWVANSGDATVSKLDSRTNRELARYPSVVNSGQPWADASSSSEGEPSRTAVDQNFDAYVANRAFDRQGSVTKYANDERNCIDRNANGLIDTSRDIDGDGSISADAALGEYIGAEDECIVWSRSVGPGGGLPRALAVGLAAPDERIGKVFVGLFDARQACVLDPQTGDTEVCIDQGNFQSYGAASDGAGRVWFVSREGSHQDVLGYLDHDLVWHLPSRAPDCIDGRPEPYGVTVDGDNQVYFATSNCRIGGVYIYRPSLDQWDQVSIPNGGTGRGVAVGPDNLWVAISGDGQNDWNGGSDRIEQFDRVSLGHLKTHRMPEGRSPVGVGISFDGSVWAINQESETATRLDLTVPEGDPGRWVERQVGSVPYTYSDFIGFGLNVFTDPRGSYDFVVEGCDGLQTASWRGVQWQSEEPTDTDVVVFVRSADSEADLASQPWIGPFEGNPTNLTEAPGPVPDGKFLEVELLLTTSNQETAPRVFSVDVVRECGVVIQ